MSVKTNKKKDKQLGMSFSTASNRLKKLLFFALICETGNNVCFRCGKEIETAADLTVDHKIDWMDSDDPAGLFFDLENISFSHSKCNIAAGRKNPVNAKDVQEGHLWCGSCKQGVPIENFGKVKPKSKNGRKYRWICNSCRSKRKWEHGQRKSKPIGGGRGLENR